MDIYILYVVSLSSVVTLCIMILCGEVSSNVQLLLLVCFKNTFIKYFIFP